MLKRANLQLKCKFADKKVKGRGDSIRQAYCA